MTKRERLERKLERRKEWADKSAAKCSAEFEAAHKITENIPFGQPILAVKVMENGQLFIIKNGVHYNVLGTVVR